MRVEVTRIELRQGDGFEVLGDVDEVDTFISDPPYSPRTHQGSNAGVESVSTVRDSVERKLLEYDPLERDDVHALISHWASRVRGWFVIMTDHTSIPWYEQAFQEIGLLSFAPIPFVDRGSRVRLTGDGPSNWSVYVLVARPRNREFAKWGTLPGAYVLPRGQRGKKHITGGKPLWVMRQLVKDYSRDGDLIVDPFSGAATTLIAASTEGRRAIGAELDIETFELARQRIEAFEKNVAFIDATRKGKTAR
jgi:hypothetical protein